MTTIAIFGIGARRLPVGMFMDFQARAAALGEWTQVLFEPSLR
ncbi:hypothetical protein [Tahibacter soli]|jgi:hypothetical protein|uniref:Uncharacterized protein n=1 Tax=Tahibacter soli TaxID=2983605 RepID=A0A9X3YJN3_9GAMM|nr:hypothetical protein [Tahibacter soli]MDC8012784.1 hypothetical protein [Tahibacter soli]